MSAHCCDHGHENANAAAQSPVYRRILWVALAVNLAMFVVAWFMWRRPGS